VVVATHSGTNVHSSSTPQYSTADSLYVDMALINNGTSPSGAFNVRLMYDSVVVSTTRVPSLAAGVTFKIEDLVYPRPGQVPADAPLAVGSHAVEMIIDADNEVVETDESQLDNRFKWTINVQMPAPRIQSSNTVQGTAGSYFSYQIIASNMPTVGGSYSMGGAALPFWIEIDPDTGLIFGTPPLDPAPTSFSMVVTASNGSGSGSLTVNVTINPERPVIISPLYATAVIGEPFIYIADHTGSQPTWTIVPMPQAGLTAAGNIISGIPTQAATIFVTLTASNTAGTDIEIMRIDILGPPVFTGDLSITGTVGVPFSFQMSTTQNPYFFATGAGTLPTGLTLNPFTGEITGVPTAGAAGTHTVPMFATNSQGSGSGTMTLAIRLAAEKPAITGPKTMYGFTGCDFFYGIQTTPLPSDATEGFTYFSSGDLPPGVGPKMVSTCNPLNGVITSVFTGEFLGVPAHAKKPIGALGSWPITVTATYKDKNGLNQSVSEPVVLIIDGDRPHFRNAAFKLGMPGQQGQTAFQAVSTTAIPTTYFPGSSTPFGGVGASPFSMGLAIFGGTGGAPGLYWNRLIVDHALNGTNLEIDPWPYIPVGIREPDSAPCPNSVSPAPIVPMSTFTAFVGDPTNFNAGAGAGAYVATLQTDASFNRNFILGGTPSAALPSDGLIGFPNPTFGLTTTFAEMPLSTIGLAITGAGTIVGAPAPTHAGVFYVKIQLTQSNIPPCNATLTGFGLCTIHIEHNGPGQGIVISPRAVVGEFNKPFSYTFQYANGTNTPFLTNALPVGLSFGGQTISGVVAHDPANGITHPAFNAVKGCVGPITLLFTHPMPNTTRFKDYNSFAGAVDYTVNGSNGQDTSTPKPVAITLVFFDKASDKPQVVSSPRVTASELVPFEYRVVATNNAALIVPVVGTNVVGSLLPLPRAFTPGNPNGSFMTISSTFDSQAYIRGIPAIGTSEFYPSDPNDLFGGEVMKPKTHSVLLECSNAGGTKYGWSVVDLRITPAIPVVTPALDSGVQIGLNQVRTVGMSAVSIVADNPSLAHPFYEPIAGYGGGSTPGFRIGAFQYEDEDTYWNRYLIPPYNANRGFLYGSTQLPGGMSLQTNSSLSSPNPGLIGGTLTTVELTESTVSTYNSYGADSRTVVFRSRPIEITSPLIATGLVGNDLVYQITATGNANAFTATGLPPGMNINPLNGLISGKPLIPSDPANPVNPVEFFAVTLTASNAWDTATQMLCLRVAQVPFSPIITSNLNVVTQDGSPFSYQITAFSQGPGNVDIPLTDMQAFLLGTNPAQFLLPRGLTFDAQRVIGPVAIVTSASRTSNISTITTTVAHGFIVGQKVLLQLSPPDANYDGEVIVTAVPVTTSFTYSRTGVNLGTTVVTGTAQAINPTFGRITGTPSEFGSFDIVLTASNVYGLGGAILHLNILPTLATITSPLITTGIVGLPFTQVSPSNYTFTATGSSAITFQIPPTQLPPGLTLNGNVISGTPTQRGTYPMIVTASNPAGSVQQTITIVIYQRPRITSTLAVTLTVGETLNYNLTASGSPELLTFNASPVPPGTIFSGTAITGRPTRPGVTEVIMDATNITGALYTDESRVTLTVTVLAMQITNNPLLIIGTLGQAITPFQITATGNPTSFAATGLPRGLVIDPGSGVIQGIPLVAGTFQATISASNGIGFAETSLIIAISPGNGIPAITSPLTATGVVNSLIPFTYTITGSNAPSSFNAVPVQPGLTLTDLGLSIDQSSGLIVGTPLLSGTYEILLSASNGNGTGTATLILGISTQPGSPAIISSLRATTMVGIPFNYTIRASNSPTFFGATINGNSIGTIGLSINATTGIISGAATTPGIFTILMSASNGTGQPGTAILTLTVLPAQVPIITSALTATGTVGSSFFYVIDASGFPTVYGASSLPPGLTIDTSTGVIRGNPLLAGIYSVPISAGNIYGVATATLTITITTIPGSPVITSATSVFGSVGQPFSYQITATNSPTSFAAFGLPAGLSLNVATGLISGTPSTVVTSNAIVLATNTIGTGSAQITISIASPFPTITSATDLTGNVGVPFSYQITATGLQPITFTLSQLPAGLTLIGNMITGIPTAQGVINAVITATNSLGPTLTPIRFTIGPAIPPTIISALSALSMVNVPFSYTIVANGSIPMTLIATNLPPGLIQAGNSIVGIPTVAGSYAVTLTANNAGGTDVRILAITVLTLAPNVDTDGDGFPDELEIALGTDPLNPNSTPFRGAPANADPFHLASPKLSVKMSFVKLESDSLTLSGSLPLPGGFTAPGQRMVVDIGGVIRAGVLNRSGKYISVDKKVSIMLSAKKPSPAGVNGRYTIKLKGTFRKELSDERLDNATPTKTPRDVQLIILVSEVAYEKITTILYSSKNGKGSGK